MGNRTNLQAACLLLLAACGSTSSEDSGLPDGGSASRPDDVRDGGRSVDAAPAPPPVPQLSFVYDEARGRLHARVKRDHPTGAVVYARTLRAGPTSTAEVDCARLAQTSAPIDLSNASSVGELLDAVGPTVNADLLPSVYGAQTGERLSRSVIEGCLVDASGRVITSLTMSLMAAWDGFAPVTSVDATTRLHGVQAYAAACEDELGDLSLFTNGTLDCVNGTDVAIVPITVSNPANPDAVVTTLGSATNAFPLNGADLAAASRCDQPAWLGYSAANGAAPSQCSPFSRVAASVNAKGTRIVIVCRRYALRAKSDPLFDDVNLIAHNPTTGKTCFFNSRLEAAQDASRVPAPTAPDGDRFWMDVRDVASVRCTNCHDADPWIHSPWVDQVKSGAGHTLVPRIGEDSAYSKATKYSVFARESLTVPSRNGDVPWEQPSQLVDAGKCGGCHRIGTKASVVDWVGRSVGDASSATFFNRWVSDAYRTTAKLRWMSPGATESTPDDAAAVRAILACGGRGASCASTPTPH